MNSLQYLLTIFIYVALGTSLLVMAVKSPLITDLTEFESKHHLGIDWESFMNLSSDTVMVTSVDSIQRIICGKFYHQPRSVDVWENFKTLKKKDREKIWKLIRIQKKEKRVIQLNLNILYHYIFHMVFHSNWHVLKIITNFVIYGIQRITRLHLHYRTRSYLQCRILKAMSRRGGENLHPHLPPYIDPHHPDPHISLHPHL